MTQALRTSLDHLPAAKRRELERVARILFDEFEDAVQNKLTSAHQAGRILKLILFGSHARGDWVEDRESGYRSDYDLLVVVNNEAVTDADEVWNDAAERLLRELTVTRHLATPVNFIVHSLDDFNRQLLNGRPFFTDIACDGIALYEAEGYPLRSPRALSADAVRSEAQRHFDQWSPLATHALKLAQDSIIDGVPRDAAFLLHQAAERAYHCALLVLTLHSPKSHKLMFLRSLTERAAPRLIEVWPRDNRFARRAFTRLDRAYVHARYSASYDISADELVWLVERVSDLLTIVDALCAKSLGRKSMGAH